MSGQILVRPSPRSLLSMFCCRARSQFTLPRRVLISPLWAMRRKGWARCQVGKVLVEKRWCTRAMALSTAFVDKYFTGTSSAVEGVGLGEIAEETARLHRFAYGDAPLYRST